jgi:poly(A) polymerase
VSDPLRALTEAGQSGWLVGGALRDRLLGRPTTDFDVVVEGDPAVAARAAGRGAGGHAFALSDAFGAWRVAARDHSWQLDVLGLQGETLEQDLVRRDLTINAIAAPLDGLDELVDPLGGAADLAARRLRMVSPQSFRDDPLRVLRLARFAAQLGFDADEETVARARASATGLAGVSPERVFLELRALIAADGAVRGLEIMDALGATAAVLPELVALDGVEQNRFHHLDVAGHTREVLARTIALVADPTIIGIDETTAGRLTELMAQPLANELTRGQALRFGALMHDIAKPLTRAVTDEGRVTFMDHDNRGAELASEILGRLRASDRLRTHVAALCRHHLRLGFLWHARPLSRRDVYDYLAASAPVGVDVTVLSVADRLATRGDNAEAAIDAHLEVAREVIGPALDWEARPPRPPIRGDELARALQMRPGPELGRLLAELQAQAYSGEIEGPEQAVARARELTAG